MGVGGWERNALSSDSDREIETDRQADKQTDRQNEYSTEKFLPPAFKIKRSLICYLAFRL